MADAFSPNRSLILMATGGDIGTWGANLNNDCISILDNNLGGNTSISVAGGIDVTLSSSQAENFYYSFTGALTGNINVIWPTGAGFYSITNSTTGAYTLTVKPTGGTGIVVAQGQSVFVFISSTLGTTTYLGVPSNGPTFTGTVTAAGLTVTGNETVGGTLAVSGDVTMPTQTFGDSSTKGATTAFVQAALQAIYPVGSLYYNASVATNPSSLLGFGTWTAFAAGRIPIGVGTGTDINGNTLAITNGATGGEYTHTLTTPEMPSHTHTDSGHSHTLFRDISQGVGSSYYITNGVSNYATATTSISYANIQNTGGGGAHNNVQPYVGVYIWQRTA